VPSSLGPTQVSTIVFVGKTVVSAVMSTITSLHAIFRDALSSGPIESHESEHADNDENVERIRR
jgi:hypothetical protein